MAHDDFFPTPDPMTRRSWLSATLRLFGGVTGLGVLVPALSYLWPSTRRGPGASRKELSGIGDLPLWQSRTEVLNGKPVIVLNKPDGLAAYSAVCTHLGCIVHWDEQKRAFSCPCHAATFDADGQVLSGPPPEPLPVYRVTRAGERVYVES